MIWFQLVWYTIERIWPTYSPISASATAIESWWPASALNQSVSILSSCEVVTPETHQESPLIHAWIWILDASSTFSRFSSVKSWLPIFRSIVAPRMMICLNESREVPGALHRFILFRRTSYQLSLIFCLAWVFWEGGKRVYKELVSKYNSWARDSEWHWSQPSCGQFMLKRHWRDQTPNPLRSPLGGPLGRGPLAIFSQVCPGPLSPGCRSE